MAVSALRAVVTAHQQGLINRARRQLGPKGFWFFVVVLSVGALFVLLQAGGGMAIVGWYAGLAFLEEADSRFLALASFLLSMLVFVGGAFGGLAGSSRRLPWESLQAFPVSTRTLFVAELMAGAVEPMTLVEFTGLFGLCLGMSLAAPAAAPYIAVLFITSTLSLLSMQLLVASLGQRLSKQARMLFFLLPLAAQLGASLLPALLTKGHERTRDELIASVEHLVRALPIGQLLVGAAHAVQGHWSAVPMLPALAVAMVLLVAAWFAVSRETPLSAVDTGKKAKRLWSFVSPTFGVARLQWVSLAGSIPGRFGLVMPLITLVLVRGPLADFTGRGEWVVPGAFVYCAFAGTNLLFNQFGLDRHGVKALLLLPISDESLLRGKFFGFAAWQALQAMLLTGLLVLTGRHKPLELALGLLLYVCLFLVLSTVGQFSSLWQPQPMTRATMRGAQPPLTVVLLMMFTLSSWSAFSLGLLWAVRSWAPGWEVPVFFWLALMLGLASHLVLKGNAMFLRASREKLLEALGAGT